MVLVVIVDKESVGGLGKSWMRLGTAERRVSAIAEASVLRLGEDEVELVGRALPSDPEYG